MVKKSDGKGSNRGPRLVLPKSELEIRLGASVDSMLRNLDDHIAQEAFRTLDQSLNEELGPDLNAEESASEPVRSSREIDADLLDSVLTTGPSDEMPIDKLARYLKAKLPMQRENDDLSREFLPLDEVQNEANIGLDDEDETQLTIELTNEMEYAKAQDEEDDTAATFDLDTLTAMLSEPEDPAPPQNVAWDDSPADAHGVGIDPFGVAAGNDAPLAEEEEIIISASPYVDDAVGSGDEPIEASGHYAAASTESDDVIRLFSEEEMASGLDITTAEETLNRDEYGTLDGSASEVEPDPITRLEGLMEQTHRTEVGDTDPLNALNQLLMANPGASDEEITAMFEAQDSGASPPIEAIETIELSAPEQSVEGVDATMPPSTFAEDSDAVAETAETAAFDEEIPDPLQALLAEAEQTEEIQTLEMEQDEEIPDPLVALLEEAQAAEIAQGSDLPIEVANDDTSDVMLVDAEADQSSNGGVDEEAFARLLDDVTPAQEPTPATDDIPDPLDELLSAVEGGLDTHADAQAPLEEAQTHAASDAEVAVVGASPVVSATADNDDNHAPIAEDVPEADEGEAQAEGAAHEASAPVLTPAAEVVEPVMHETQQALAGDDEVESRAAEVDEAGGGATLHAIPAAAAAAMTSDQTPPMAGVQQSSSTASPAGSGPMRAAVATAVIAILSAATAGWYAWQQGDTIATLQANVETLTAERTTRQERGDNLEMIQFDVTRQLDVFRAQIEEMEAKFKGVIGLERESLRDQINLVGRRIDLLQEQLQRVNRGGGQVTTLVDPQVTINREEIAQLKQRLLELAAASPAPVTSASTPGVDDLSQVQSAPLVIDAPHTPPSETPPVAESDSTEPAPAQETPERVVTPPSAPAAQPTAGVAPSATNEPAPAAPPSQGGTWYVNFASVPTQSSADSEQQRLKGVGIDAEQVEVLKGGRVWYRLQVRGFESHQAANDYAQTYGPKAGIKTPWVANAK